MKIGIIGLGQVGETLDYGFRRIGHDVVGHDVKSANRFEQILETEVCFICVPTASKPDGSCDTSIVRSVCSSLHDRDYEGVVAIKSTVPPGTTDDIQYDNPNIQFAFCPEFLRERARYSDFVEHHDVCIVGVHIKREFDIIKEAHGSLPKEFVHVTPMEAEFCKYFSNCFNALRITFANEFHDICAAAGVDYRNVKNAITKKKTIGESYLDSSVHFRAFGGNCLPKDLSAMIEFAKSLGVDPELLTTIKWLNAEQAKAKDVKAA